MHSDCGGPARSLEVTYELLDYKSPNERTQFDATPVGRPHEIKQILPTTGVPLAGARVAGLRPNPLPPAREIPNKAWKPKGRK